MRTQRRLGRLSLLAILTMLAGLILAGPAHATFPGPNGQIAFLEGTTGQLYTINPDGTGLRQLTHLSPPSFPTRPDWSPDGRRIAFADLGDARLYVIDRDGSHQHLVFADTSGYKDFFPKYAPDGGRLVFSRCQPGDSGSCAIFSVRTNGTHLHGLTPFTQGSQPRADFGATVSPDGRRIAFRPVSHRRRPGTGLRHQGRRQRRSCGHPAGTWGVRAGLDPRRPPSSGDQQLLPAQRRHLPAQPGRQRSAAPDRPARPHNDGFPSAAPQGNRIALTSDRAYPDLCCADLFVMRGDGSGLHKVPTGDLNEVIDPDWGRATPDDAPAS